MKHQLKKQMRAVFEPPPARGKAAFLRTVQAPQMGFGGFFLGQIRYIRKRVWLTWGGFLALLPLLSQTADDFLRLFWLVSALLPFAALLVMAELARSSSFRMAELEMACRFTLHRVILTRMSILGAGSLMVLLGLSLLMARQPEGFALPRAALYLTCPYLTTCAGSLFALNRLPVSDALPLCGGVSLAVSLGCVLLSSVPIPSLPFWVGLTLVGLALTLIQGSRFFQKTEELPWSSSLTA